MLQVFVLKFKRCSSKTAWDMCVPVKFWIAARSLVVQKKIIFENVNMTEEVSDFCWKIIFNSQNYNANNEFHMQSYLRHTFDGKFANEKNGKTSIHHTWEEIQNFNGTHISREAFELEL